MYKKIITKHKSLHLEDDMNRVHVSRKKGQLVHIKNCVNAGLDDYVKETKENELISLSTENNVIGINYTKDKNSKYAKE